jgi:alkylhydroperoxidase family enzyme
MPRLAPLPIEQLDAQVQQLCREAEAATGTSASTRTYAHHPGVLKALAAFRAELARVGTLEPVLKELVRLELASLNACRY